jgi:hypothetical protein
MSTSINTDIEANIRAQGVTTRVLLQPLYCVLRVLLVYYGSTGAADILAVVEWL